MNKPVYALSVRQMWAWLLCQKDMKDVENRNWHLKDRRFVPDDLKFPVRIYIHASKTPESDPDAYFWIAVRLSPSQSVEFVKASSNTILGALIGEVTITHYTLISKSPWFVGKYGFVREDPEYYQKPIPCRGALGFFKPDIREEVN